MLKNGKHFINGQTNAFLSCKKPWIEIWRPEKQDEYGLTLLT